MRTSLDYDAAHTFVENNPAAFWDGWDIVIFTPTPYGFSNEKGAFRTDPKPRRGKKAEKVWGMDYRVSCDENGLWNLNHKSVKANA